MSPRTSIVLSSPCFAIDMTLLIGTSVDGLNESPKTVKIIAIPATAIIKYMNMLLMDLGSITKSPKY